MKAPLSWIKEYVDIDLPVPDLAHLLTLAGLEVEEIHYIGHPLPGTATEGEFPGFSPHRTKITGFAWDPERIVVGAIQEVMPHPDADRLVLCRLDDGVREHIVLTGAPNLFPYKGKGPLDKPIKVAYAREGSRLFDGHKPGQELMTLKRTKIRGVDSYSMACSEKELGISDEHEGIIFLDEDAPVGEALASTLGDIVLDIAITPNIARNANILGIAREIAALTGKELRKPASQIQPTTDPIKGSVTIEIQNPDLNPRFVLGLIKGIEIKPSPYHIQFRLRAAGMRPINNIVDATNYVMLELGQPLHAFDYDVLVQRAGGGMPVIITRNALPGERLVTLDGVDHQLEEFTVLVCDRAGSLSIAGVMGGEESEVNPNTRNVLLEGAAWNFINIRQTLTSLRMNSEAAYRFSRGVHPAMAERGVSAGLRYMHAWAGGMIASGLVDNYPKPPTDPVINITPFDVQRLLGISLDIQTIASLLSKLEFGVTVENQSIRVKTPDHRLDIGEGITGKADLIEEIARMYGYDAIPETRMADELPSQHNNRSLEIEERVRDILVNLGLQEIITYRLTSKNQEDRILPSEGFQDHQPYVTVTNPITSDRTVLRKSLLASSLDIASRNARIRDQITLFEIGPVFLPSEGGKLPNETLRLVLIMTGMRQTSTWGDQTISRWLSFFDLKGVITQFLECLHIGPVVFEPTSHPSFHPGKCARICAGDRQIGVFGEIHPVVQRNFSFSKAPVLGGEIQLDAIIELVPEHFPISPVPIYPPVLEDIAIVIDKDIPAERVTQLIQEAGGDRVISIQLFDLYQGDQIEAGKKSLAFNITYQSFTSTLTDEQVLKVRQRILHRLNSELGAELRSV